MYVGVSHFQWDPNLMDQSISLLLGFQIKVLHSMYHDQIEHSPLLETRTANLHLSPLYMYIVNLRSNKFTGIIMSL